MPIGSLYLCASADALGYLLEVAGCEGQLQGISLPKGEEMVNNHFADESLLSVSAEQGSIAATRDFLSVF